MADPISCGNNRMTSILIRDPSLIDTRFKSRRKTVLKTGDSQSVILTVVANITAEDYPDEIPATPRMIALDKLSPERPYPEVNRKSRREELKGRAGRWNLKGNGCQ